MIGLFYLGSLFPAFCYAVSFLYCAKKIWSISRIECLRMNIEIPLLLLSAIIFCICLYISHQHHQLFLSQRGSSSQLGNWDIFGNILSTNFIYPLPACPINFILLRLLNAKLNIAIEPKEKKNIVISDDKYFKLFQEYDILYNKRNKERNSVSKYRIALVATMVPFAIFIHAPLGLGLLFIGLVMCSVFFYFIDKSINEMFYKKREARRQLTIISPKSKVHPQS